MARRRHLVAFNRSIRARGIEGDVLLGPLVELGRDLARELDSVSGPIAGTRTVAAYRGVLKEMGRWQRPPAAIPAPTPERPKNVSTLEEFKSRAGISAGRSGQVSSNVE